MDDHHLNIRNFKTQQSTIWMKCHQWIGYITLQFILKSNDITNFILNIRVRWMTVGSTTDRGQETIQNSIIYHLYVFSSMVRTLSTMSSKSMSINTSFKKGSKCWKYFKKNFTHTKIDGLKQDNGNSLIDFFNFFPNIYIHIAYNITTIK